jgi:tRNA pseudouridine55 synthase
MRHNPDKQRLPAFSQHGALLVDKPKTWTSFDVVNFIRSRFNIPKVGHCGTLDPAATGLLVIVIGKFTKLSDKFSGQDKIYEATMLLGAETDSQDMDGSVTAQSDFSSVTAAQIKKVIAGFVGVQQQIPPMVSAVKKDGKKLYELARKGIEIERDAKTITIKSIRIRRIEPPYVDITVECSKGTYIRTLCADIGRKLGCGAALYALNRLKSGEFDLKDAVSLDTIKTWEQTDLDDRLRSFLLKKIAKMNL